MNTIIYSNYSRDNMFNTFKDGTSNYKIIESLGEGGYSQIYKAIDHQGRIVILKFADVSLIGDLATYERFQREFKIGQELDHPAIPKAIALENSREGVFIVLEYIEGKSLRSIINTLSQEGALSIAEQLADALQYLHDHGVYHRDLKPENIIVGTDGKIHIVDFGIAFLEGARRVTWKIGTNPIGTPDYMAPEQIVGKRGDARSDIYALGIILYEMITGTVPFSGDNALSILNQKLTANPVPPTKIKSIPLGLEAIILKAIRRDPDKRYQSAGEFGNDLTRFADIDLSQFKLGEEPPIKGLLTGRQIFIKTIYIFIAFLTFVILIVLIFMIINGKI